MPNRDQMTERTRPSGGAGEPEGVGDPLDRLEEQPGFFSPPVAHPVVGSAQPLAIGTLEDLPPVLGAGSVDLGGPVGRKRLGDRVMHGLTAGAGGFVVLLIALVAFFLLIKAIPSITADHDNFLTSRDWDVDGTVLHYGVLPLLWTTVLIS